MVEKGGVVGKASSLLSYGVLGLPLAFLGFPLYVFLPKYLTALGLSLTDIALLLLITRLVDAVQDPLIGAWSSRYNSLRKQSLMTMSALGILALLGMTLFHQALTFWPLLILMIFIYTTYSLCFINYYALGAILPMSYGERTSLTTTREGFFLVGVLLFASMPILLGHSLEERVFYGQLGMVLALATLGALGGYTFFHKKLPQRVKPLKPYPLKATFKNPHFLTISFLFFLSILAASIPGALFIFYVKNILKAPDTYVGFFLIVYFLSGVVGMPLWHYLGKCHGQIFSKRLLWFIGSGLALGCFVWAFFLSSGSFGAFYAICVGSGLALGLDLALPPSILADHVSEKTNASAFFGLWAFINKLAMSLGASGGLYVVSLWGFQEGALLTSKARLGLSLTYAIIPCLIKGIFLVLLWRFKWVGVKSA